MKIISIQSATPKQAASALDFSVDQGYRQGPGRVLADVDVDYQSDRRQEVKEYLERRNNKDGMQRVFSAGTFSTLKLKACLKDVARVHKVPVAVVNYITAIIEDDKSGWTELFQLAATNSKVRKFIQDYPLVIEDLRGLLGQPRSASIHASAILITPQTRDGEPAECFDYTPIKKVDDTLVSELDGYSLDEVGLLKNDCLGIKELTKLQTVINEANRIYNADISFEGVVRSDLNDEKTYRLLSEGHTANVFQLSSRGMTRYLMDMRPFCINDLIAANALYRPATLESGATENYLRCKLGEVAPVYLWGTYDALQSTYAQLIYQEQVSQIVREVGGFTLGDGVSLVKLISKKKVDAIHSMKEKFMAGAKERGCPNEDANAIWELMESAGSYLFNKSHATAYAITGYVGAWLKANYPTAFYTVALQFAEDKEIATLMSEMEQCSRAKIVPPEINHSGVEFYTDYRTDEIFWSLGRIRMCGIKTVEYIIAERNRGGRFTSISNFIHRIFRYKLRKYEFWDDPDNAEEAVRVPVNARHIKNLVLAGCFDKVEKVEALTDRLGILQRAARELGFELPKEDFPSEATDKYYFWSVRQIEVSGIGQIDYRRIYDQNEVRDKIRGKASWMTLRDALIMENEGRRIAVCATVIDVEELSYKDKMTGERKPFVKLKLQQNNDLCELVCWNDFLVQHKDRIGGLKDRIIIATAVIRYSDYCGTNTLNTFNSSIITHV